MKLKTILILCCIGRVLFGARMPVHETYYDSDGNLIHPHLNPTNVITWISSANGVTNGFNYTNSVWCPYTFSLDESAQEVTTMTNTIQRTVMGRFWTEWEVLEGQIERTQPTMERQGQYYGDQGGYRTNFFMTTNLYFNGGMLTFTNNIYHWGQPPECQKEHLDTTPQVEHTYTQSNLLAKLVWRGWTNTWCLESICCHTNTRTWNWEKRKVYK